MWVFLSTRLRRWLLFTAVLPLVGLLARSAADRVERRRGPSTLTRGLRHLGALDRRARRRGR
ncbi:MAG TPA: hypothetical protein VKB14_04070 [Actinomycetales bacterium]|nr:hypothetical protein [Actinomycetales bacterium]